MCNFFPIVIWATTMSTIVSQSCREYSQSCIDDQACCGGCCIQGICEDIYVDCRLGGDPCSRVSCPPEEECYIYKPTDCQGCGYSTQCRSVPEALQEHQETTPYIKNESPKQFTGKYLFISFVITVHASISKYV